MRPTADFQAESDRRLPFGQFIRWIPLLIFVVGVLLSVLQWNSLRQQAEEKSRIEFEFLLNQAVDAIRDRLTAHEQVLRSVVGLYAASEHVSRQEFGTFVASLRLDERYPGIQGIGFSELIRPDQMQRHIRSVRAEGFPDYQPYPPGNRELYTSIIYLEPFDWRNKRAFGYDMYSNPIRRQAMERAMDTGKAALSDRVTLVQETETDVQAGLLLYVPIYRGGVTPDDVASRRADLFGWAYSPLRMKDMMSNLLKRDLPQLAGRIKISIYDGDALAPGAMLFSTEGEREPGALSLTRQMEISGQSWTVTAEALSGFGETTRFSKANIVLVAGLLVSFLVAFMVAILNRGHAKATAALSDLTAAHADLDRQQKELQLIYDTSSAGIFFVDMRGLITHANKRMSEMFACPMERLLGSEYIMHTHPDERDAGRQKMLALLCSEIPSVSLDRRYWRDDGSEFWGHLTGNRLTDSSGNTVGLVGVIADITEFREKADELERYREHLEDLVAARTAELATAKEAAVAANRAKSAFLANMSHELRTPMNGVMGMIDIVLRQTRDPKQQSQLTTARQASQHLLGVINSILDISKIEAERLTLEQLDFELGDVLARVESILGPSVSEKHLKLVTDIPNEVARLSLRGDSVRLGQILLNLAGNAVKFSDHGEIRLQVRQVVDTSGDVLLRFEVADSGIGISVEDQKRLFTAFEQADTSMTRKYGGTGLGLAISKRLVQMMGGDIGLESAPGMGSKFWFTVCFKKGPATTAGARHAPQISPADLLVQRHTGRRVLLAEDEPVNQEVSTTLLEDVGLQVDLAENGVDTLDLARRNVYDLILMDIQMPELNGFDATREIRTNSLNTATPILAMTANAFDEDRHQCLEAGMNDHISKPIVPDRLFETLLRWLEKRA